MSKAEGTTILKDKTQAAALHNECLAWREQQRRSGRTGQRESKRAREEGGGKGREGGHPRSKEGKRTRQELAEPRGTEAKRGSSRACNHA